LSELHQQQNKKTLTTILPIIAFYGTPATFIKTSYSLFMQFDILSFSFAKIDPKQLVVVMFLAICCYTVQHNCC